MQGKIIEIYTYPQAGAQGIAQSSIEIIAGSGIISDRYYTNQGTFSNKKPLKPKQEITFIESEEIDNFNLHNNCQLTYAQLRRNIITLGVELNNLVGQEFKFGNQLFKGIELCEPCAYLAKTVESKILPAMIGKCGLRAQILSNGRLSSDDLFALPINS